MGAMVATAWAQKYPTEIEACVLINTSFTAFNPFHERLRLSAWPALLQLLLARNPCAQERLVFNLTSRLSDMPQSLLDEWVAIRQSRPVRLRNALRQLFAAARFRAPASAPALTLILASGADGLVNSGCSMEIAHRWNTAIANHPTAGHDLPLDDGKWVIREICAWLSATSLQH
jgi:pimeloyl-ACP methyl ester carboxylesterase